MIMMYKMLNAVIFNVKIYALEFNVVFVKVFVIKSFIVIVIFYVHAYFN